MKAELHTTDTDIELAMLIQLSGNGMREITDLKIWVSDGVVYLSGYVPDLKYKRIANKIASRMEGVRDIVNMLRVAPQPVEA